jgi:protein-tyrosine kinase
MSKIERALRLARNQHKIKADDTEDGNSVQASRSNKKFDKLRNRSSLPAVVRLEPNGSYELDTENLVRNRIIDDEFPEVALTSYKMLRTRVLQKMNANDWCVLAVTSPRDGAGKSLTSINLAISMASQGLRDVYLLDLDLRNPQIANKLGIPGFELDLGEFLAGRTPISRVCCEVGIERMLVLPSSQRQPNSSELLTSELMQGLLKTIRSTVSNPIVVIDVPPILSADDALAISPWVDGFLLVVSESQTDRDDVTRSIEMLRDSNVVGVVLNKSTDHQ